MSLGGLEKGLDSVIGDSEGQEETMEQSVSPLPRCLMDLLPRLLKPVRRFLLHEPCSGPALPFSCAPRFSACHKFLCCFLALYNRSCCFPKP